MPEIDPIITKALTQSGTIYRLAKLIPCSYQSAWRWCNGLAQPNILSRKRLELIASGKVKYSRR